MEEKDLIRRINSGEKELFEQIVNKYNNYIYSICLNILRNPEDARDTSQETFYKVYKSLKKFDCSKSQFSTWIYRIAYNKSIDVVRKKNSFLNFKSFFSKDSSYDYQKHKFDNEIVYDLISELSEKDAALITFYYLNELSIKEICYVVDESESNIKVKLHRIRKRLQEIATKKYNKELSPE